LKRSLWCLGLGLSIWVIAWLILGGIPSRIEESIVLRWSRACLDHPVRSPLALAMIIWACLPRGEPRGQFADQPAEMDAVSGEVDQRVR
jgi:hypothetical protein